jgi:heptose I phosphotransferase
MPVVVERTAAMPPVRWTLWDGGRLRINEAFADLLRTAGLESFAAGAVLDGGEIVRAVGPRVTRRIMLGDGAARRSFFLKRHAPVRLGERVKPWLRLSSGVFGARPEWEALLKFHAAGLPTMTPVACGEAGEHSWLLTEGLESPQNLLDWTRELASRSHSYSSGVAAEWDSDERLRIYLIELAKIARRMHDAGLHHQDFYLNHVLLCETATGNPELRVIDLGRVREQQPLSQRWILKDLSQLNYSARHLTCRTRLRFLRQYLGRPFCDSDRRLIWWLEQKAAQIARHTDKHRL